MATSDALRAVVEAYIADHNRWERESDERYYRLPRRASDGAKQQCIAEIRASYAALLAAYCRPGLVGQSVAFSNSPLHDLAWEMAISVRIRGGKCLVRTRLAGESLDADFEYRLILLGERWYLESVKCVFPDGRYECF